MPPLIIDPSSQQEFSDADWAVVDNGDQSKKFKLQVSGLSANTTRTGSVPDADGTLYLTGNVLGTVSQSGGVPTGALIERGSNANGEYARFADGTQICTSVAVASGAMSSAHGALFISGSNVTWTYPATFAAQPNVAVSAIRTAGTGVIFPAFLNTTPGTTSYAIRMASPITGTEANIYFIALGRWF